MVFHVRLYTPPLFAAREIMLDGKRAIRLAAEELGEEVKIINLVVHQELPESVRFPAAYEYIDTPSGSVFDLRSPRSGILRIVAAPGVSVLVEKWPEISTTFLEVVRVQDPQAVPPQATAIEPISFPSHWVVSLSLLGLPTEQTAKILPRQYPLDYFVIEHTSSGTVITHPYSTFSLALDFPSNSLLGKNASDAKARFSYQVIPSENEAPNGFPPPMSLPPRFLVVKTLDVKASLRGGPPKISFFKHLYEQHQYIMPFEVYEAPDIMSVPSPGQDIAIQAAWKKWQNVTIIPNWMDDETYEPVRFVLGVIPVVSDVLDIAEFILATETGKDFRGRQLTENEKLFLAMGVMITIIPFSSPALFKMFGSKFSVIKRLKTSLKAASVTPAEGELLHEATEAVRRGGKPTQAQLNGLSDLLTRMPSEYPSIDAILNADKSAFIQPELQEAYRAYSTGKVKAGKEALSPTEWAAANTRGKNSDILVRILGPNYRKAAVEGTSAVPGRVFNMRQIMKPLGYSDDQVKEHLEFILKYTTFLSKRLRPLLADLRSNDKVVAAMAKEIMSFGRFSHVKGVIGEIFALPLQKYWLQASYRDASLFTGVTIQRKSGKIPVQFTDNIIAITDGKNIEIKVVFEVKAGKRGGAEATMQIFQWIEDRLEEGDKLIIPAGSKYYDATGREMVLAKELRAYYGRPPIKDPVDPEAGRVFGLANAERKILVSKGTSLLGVDSRDQAPVIISREDLPVTSSQIDYLVGQLVQILE